MDIRDCAVGARSRSRRASAGGGRGCPDRPAAASGRTSGLDRGRSEGAVDGAARAGADKAGRPQCLSAFRRLLPHGRPEQPGGCDQCGHGSAAPVRRAQRRRGRRVGDHRLGRRASGFRGRRRGSRAGSGAQGGRTGLRHPGAGPVRQPTGLLRSPGRGAASAAAAAGRAGRRSCGARVRAPPPRQPPSIRPD